MEAGICNKSIVIGIFLFLIRWSVTGQDYSITIYDQTRGFEKNNVYTIERDAQGFIWLGTDQGIVRFDGANFLEFPVPEGQPGDVFRLKIFGDNLFVIFREAGVGVIDLKTYSYHTLNAGKASDVLELPDGSVIIYLIDGTLMRMSGARKLAVTNIGTGPLASLFYRWGALLAVNKTSGLIRLDPMTLKTIKQFSIDCCPRLVNFQNVKDRILLSSEAGFYELDSTFVLRPVRFLDDPEMLKAHSNWIRHSSGDAFFILREREVVKKTRNVLRSFPVIDKRLAGLRTIYVYDSNNILAGANGGLVHLRTTPAAFTSLNQDGVIAEPDFRVRRKIISLNTNDYVLLGNPGFIRWKNDHLSKIILSVPASTNDGVLLGSDVYATAESWILFRYDTLTKKQEQIHAEGISESDNLYCIALDSSDNSLIIGGREAMFRYNPLSRQVIRTKSIGNSDARVVARIPGTSNWSVGTTDGLYILDEKLNKLTSFRNQEGQLRGKVVSDLLPLDRNRLWLAHEHGAEMVDLNKMKVTDSLPPSLFTDPRITAVLKDKRNNLWFSTFKGIVGFDPRTRGIVKLESRIDLINLEYNYKSAALLADGRLMFGGLNGYDLIDPAVFSFNSSRPDGIISGYRLTGDDGKIELHMQAVNPGEIDFDTEHQSVRIFLASRRLLNSATNTFEFRLNGGSWNSLGNTAHLDIYKLRPGNYKLEFRGYDLYGTLLTFPAIELHANIIFYKSTIFIVTMAVLVVVLFAMILMIIRRNRKKEKRLKEDIAMDLHDEVGTIFTKAVLAYRSESIENSPGKVESYLKEGLHSLRLFINTMNRTTIPLERLVLEVRETIFPYLKSAGIEVEIDYKAADNLNLPSVLYRDLKLCIYEAVNNAIKHSSANRFQITFIQSGSFLELLISDNGSLTDDAVIENKGSGVGNFRKRTDRHRGSVKFSVGQDGHGLSILFRFLLKSNANPKSAFG